MAAWSTLKRNKPLRRSSLNRRSSLHAKSTCHRKAGVRYKHSRIPDHVATAVKLRAGGFCERCGRAETERAKHTFHHIQKKGQLGPDTVENLAYLCYRCHNFTEVRPEIARKQGWLVRGVGRLSKTVNTFPREG